MINLIKGDLIILNEVDSTSKYIKRNIENLNNCSTIIANIQNDGVGRYGRIWKSGSNTDLLCSILIKENISLDKLSNLSLVVGVAIHKLLSKYNVKSLIKYPNDIMVNNLKIAGILIESKISADSLVENIIIGIGININSIDFGFELKDKAISMRMVTNTKFSIIDVLDKLRNILNKELVNYLNGDTKYIKIVNQYNYLFDKCIDYKGDTVTIKRISSDGKIIALNNEKEIVIEKVSYSKIYGGEKK